jgi:hypothetical protein
LEALNLIAEKKVLDDCVIRIFFVGIIPEVSVHLVHCFWLYAEVEGKSKAKVKGKVEVESLRAWRVSTYLADL